MEINNNLDFDIVLLSKLPSKYYKKIYNESNDNYYRGLDVRLCLEKIYNDMIRPILKTNFTDSKWGKMTLDKKINTSKEIIDDDILERLKKLKNIGNGGVHEGEEFDIKDSDLEESLEIIREFSLEIFVCYFKHYGFIGETKAWTPVVFSILPPIYRVKVLEKYFKSKKLEIFNDDMLDEIIYIIDKLAMAYLKSGLEKEAFEFLKECLDNRYINNELYIQLSEKLILLRGNLDKFKIAKNIKDSKENFASLIKRIPVDERDSFIILVSIILDQDVRKQKVNFEEFKVAIKFCGKKPGADVVVSRGMAFRLRLEIGSQIKDESGIKYTIS